MADIFISISVILSFTFSEKSALPGLMLGIAAPVLALFFIFLMCYRMYQYQSRLRMMLYGSTFIVFFGAVGILFATADLSLVDWKSPPASITTESIFDPFIETIAIVWAFIMLSAFLIPCCFMIAPADKLIRRVVEVSCGLLLLIMFNKLTTLAGL